MIKILIKFLAIYWILITFAFSEIIKEINITGNKRISNETVKVLGDLSLNNDFDNEKLNSSLKKLYNSNFFSDVKISLNKGILNIN